MTSDEPAAQSGPEKNRQLYSSIFFDCLIITVASLLATISLVNDWGVRISQSPQDENCVAHSIYFCNKANFNQDIYFSQWSPIGMSSIINWLPALLLKYCHLDPTISFVFLTFMQNALLPLSIYFFAKQITTRRMEAMLSAAFTMLWRPHFWNLSLIGGLDSMPYANWCALPFILFSFTALVQGRLVLCSLFLLVCSMIHPVMAALTAVSCSIFCILCFRQQALPASLSKLLIINLSAFLPSAISIFISTYGMRFIPDQDRMSALLVNQHVVPWNAPYPYGMSAFEAGTLTCISLSAVAFACLPRVSESARKLYLAVFSGTCLCVLVHFLSLALHNAILINLISTRSSILFILVSLPFLILFACQLVRQLKKGMLLPLFALFCAASPLVIFSVALAGIGSMIEKRGKQWRLLSLSLQSLGNILSLSIFVRYSPSLSGLHQIACLLVEPCLPWLLAEDRQIGLIGHLQSMVFVYALAVVFIVVSKAELFPSRLDVFRKNHASRLLAGVLLLLLFCWCCVDNAKLARIEVAGAAKSYKRIQRWAKRHTNPEDPFILVSGNLQNSWRALSQRSMVSCTLVGEVYKSTQAVRDYNRKLGEFYSRFGLDLNQLAKQPDLLKQLSGEDWRCFASKFGGKYLVVKNDWSQLQLPVSVRDSHYTIYSLSKN